VKGSRKIGTSGGSCASNLWRRATDVGEVQDGLVGVGVAKLADQIDTRHAIDSCVADDKVAIA